MSSLPDLEFVKMEKAGSDGRVAILTLNRPKALNALCRYLKSNYYIIRVTLNTESDTLQRSFFHAHAIEWIIVNVVLLESWFACIHILRSLSWLY